MDKDEELFREMEEEDDFYMGDNDYDDQDDDTPDYDEIQHHNNRVNHSGQGGGMGCLVLLPLITGTLTFVVLLIL